MDYQGYQSGNKLVHQLDEDGLIPYIPNGQIGQNDNDQKEIEPLPNPNDIKFHPVYASSQGLNLYYVIMTRHPPSWSKFFLAAEKEVRHACTMINEKSQISGRATYPNIQNVLNAFWLTPFPILKAVIIGQDPYPGHTKRGLPKAIGVCFASDRYSGEIPDSLVTIYRELGKTVEDWEHPGHADITSWGRQGVLLINSALTVEAGNPGSHHGFWKCFTESLMNYLNENCRDLVFMLWGKPAQKAADTIWASKHHKLTAYHPSSMNNGKSTIFDGCNHFNLCNEILVSKGIHPIDWRIN